MTTPILLHWVREGYRDWIEPETWLLKTARYGGETLGKLVRNKTLWGCFLADGSVENWAFETDLLRAQVKACEFLEVRAPGRYQWPIGEARYKNVQRRW